MISSVGEDSNGHATLENFDACGVDRAHVKVTSESSTGPSSFADCDALKLVRLSMLREAECAA